MKSSIALLFLTLFANTLHSECDYANAVFAVGSDAHYLKYYNYMNQFDTAWVSYRIGEYRILNNGHTTKINIRTNFIPDSNWRQGASVNGEDSILLNSNGSEYFTYPLNSQLKYFREMSKGVPCWIPNEKRPSINDVEAECQTWQDYKWVTGKNMILDDSEWVLQLVKASDNSVLSVLDSVGINRNPSTVLAQRYGFNNTKMNHTIDLPNDYADTNVYLRVSARRVGPTPYGMVLSIYRVPISLSSFCEYIDSICIVTDIEYDSLNSLYFDKIIEYCDSLKLTGNRLDVETCLRMQLTAQQSHYFHNRYFDPILYEGLTDTHYIEKDYFNKIPIHDLEHLKVKRLFKVLSLNPQPVLNKLNITYKADVDLSDVEFKVIEYDGTLHSFFIEKSIKNGSGNLSFDVSNLKHGSYFLLVSGGNTVYDIYRFIK